jgi:hypothetical protein
MASFTIIQEQEKLKSYQKPMVCIEVKISAFDYNAETQTGIVGYQSGSLDVITLTVFLW